MMSRTALDLWVGLFVAIGFAALVFLAMKVGNFSGLDGAETYRVEAPFDNIGGLKVRAPVKSSGVLVGRVAVIRFDPAIYRAVVELERAELAVARLGRLRRRQVQRTHARDRVAGGGAFEFGDQVGGEGHDGQRRKAGRWGRASLPRRHAPRRLDDPYRRPDTPL